MDNSPYGQFSDLRGIGGNDWSHVDLSCTQPFLDLESLSPGGHSPDTNPPYNIECWANPHYQDRYSSSLPTGRAFPDRVPQNLGLALDTALNPTSRSMSSLAFLQDDLHSNMRNTLHTPGLTSAPSITVCSDEMSSVVSSEQDSSADIVHSPGGSPSPVLGDESHSPSGSFLHPKWSGSTVSRGKKRKQIDVIAETHGSSNTKVPLARQSSKSKSRETTRSVCDICLETFSMPADKERHLHNVHSNLFEQSTKWICVNKAGIILPNEQWPRSTPLGPCKRCSTGFRYNASHNAEEHLRRKHFHPREPGSRPRTESERRGGKGGGRDPDVHYLKQYWIQKLVICHKEQCDCQLMHEPPPEETGKPRKGSRSHKASAVASTRSSVSDSSQPCFRGSSNASGSDDGSPMEGLLQSQLPPVWVRSPNLSAASSGQSPALSSSPYTANLDVPSSPYHTNQVLGPYSQALHPSLLPMPIQLDDYDPNDSCVFPSNAYFHGYDDPHDPSWPGP